MNGVVQTGYDIEFTHADYGTFTTPTDDWGTWSIDLEPGLWEVEGLHSCWVHSYGDLPLEVELGCEGEEIVVDLSYCMN
jgi:hypothetical protein